MSHRPFLVFICLFVLILAPLSAMRVAALNSSLAELWCLAGGDVAITVQDAVDRGIVDERDVILVDTASGRNINTEVLLLAQPDLVLGSPDTASHVRIKSLLDSLGIDMLLIRQDSFDDFLMSFKELTAMTGREDLWQEYGLGQKARIETLVSSAQDMDSHPRVLFVRAGSAFSSVRAKRSDDHFAALIMEELGAVNVADEMGLLTESLSLEAMLTADIDKLVIVAQGDEEAAQAYMENLLAQPGWRDLPCVASGEVYFLPKDLFHYKPNGRWVEAYRTMEDVLYG